MISVESTHAASGESTSSRPSRVAERPMTHLPAKPISVPAIPQSAIPSAPPDLDALSPANPGAPITKLAVLDAIRRGEQVQGYTHPEILEQPPALSVENFKLWYGKSKALHSVSMPIPERRVTALIGPSGCGKSTLLRCFNRMNDLVDGLRTEGKIALRGQDLYDRSVDAIDLRRRVGMVFQKPNPFPMSIFENVVYPLRITGERKKSVLRDACEKALRSSALWEEVKDRLHDSAIGLSGGQQQRLCIARAVAAEPEILLMDEPCSALDPIATLKIEELIHQMSGSNSEQSGSKSYTILIVTHNMHQAARVSDYTAFMYLGRLVEYGPTATIFQNPKLPETEQYVTGRFG
jgi:phosphate transport system ATP-binding protein